MTELHATSRREWLAACAGGTASLAGLAGCIDGGDGNGGDGDDDTGDDGTERLPGWPMHAADHRVSGSNPDTTGPTGEVQERWATEHNSHVASTATPVIADGVLYLGWQDASFRAMDLETGEVLWKRQFEGWQETISDSALVVEDTVYLTWNSHRVALDVSDGSTRWSVEEDSDPFQLNFYDGSIYGTKGNARQEHAQIVRWNPDDGSEEVVVEFELADVSQTLAIAADVAYVAVADSVVGVGLESGEELWRWTHPEGDPTHHADVAVADGTVFATAGWYAVQNELPGCFAIDAESGEEEWSAQDVSSYAKPSVVDGTAYVWSDEVTAVDAADGTVDWTWDAQRTFLRHAPTVAVYDGTVALAVFKSVAALEAA